MDAKASWVVIEDRAGYTLVEHPNKNGYGVSSIQSSSVRDFNIAVSSARELQRSIPAAVWTESRTHTH